MKIERKKEIKVRNKPEQRGNMQILWRASPDKIQKTYCKALQFGISLPVDLIKVNIITLQMEHVEGVKPNVCF